VRATDHQYARWNVWNLGFCGLVVADPGDHEPPQAGVPVHVVAAITLHGYAHVNEQAATAADAVENAA
jgi:hypothetical protein